MARKKRVDVGDLVHVHPTGTHYVGGVPAVDYLLPPDDAERLLRFSQAFTTDPVSDDDHLAAIRGEAAEPITSLEGISIPGDAEFLAARDAPAPTDENDAGDGEGKE